MKKAIIFLHLRKTGGTSLLKILKKQFKEESVYTLSGKFGEMEGHLEKFRNLKEERRGRYRLIHGHIAFGVHEYLPGPASYVSMLRDPVNRSLSQFFFLKYRYNTLNETFKDFELEDMFLNPEFPLHHCAIDNSQTRFLAGQGGLPDDRPMGTCDEALLERAKANLREHCLCGTTEFFDEYLLLLKREFDLGNIFYTKERVNQHRPNKDQIPEKTLQIVKKYNELDMELYEEARRLFREKMEAMDDSFFRGLRQFQWMNQIYKFYIKLNPLTKEQVFK